MMIQPDIYRERNYNHCPCNAIKLVMFRNEIQLTDLVPFGHKDQCAISLK